MNRHSNFFSATWLGLVFIFSAPGFGAFAQAPTQASAAAALGESTSASEVMPQTLFGPAPPYIPRKNDYSIDVGYMLQYDDLFWGSASMGFHLGRCMFSESQTCQQYLDGIIGAGVREGESYGLFLGSLRWQYVNFPKRYSPFWRVFAGRSYISRPSSRDWHNAGGVGVGVTTYLHDKVDLRFELRGGASDRAFVQGIVGIQIKADRLLQFFAVKLRDLGYGTVSTALEATGTALRATGEGLGGIVEGVAAPFKNEDQKASSSPSQEPEMEKKSVPSPAQ